MRIHFLSASATAYRSFNHIHRIKLVLSSNKPLLFKNKILEFHNRAITRVICTDSNLQSCNYAIYESEKLQSLDFQDNFLKENFNITDSYYLKQVALHDKYNNIDGLLWTNEFKYILSRSPFSYDVNFHEASAISIYEPFESFPINECNDLAKTAENQLIGKEHLYLCDKVYLQNNEAKETVNKKPTEEQLLVVIDRLTYSLVNFFEKPIDFSIYHKNIVFQNNIKGVTIRGLSAYVQSMYLMKFYGYLHFAKVKVEILKVTHHIEDGTIRVRWRVNGLPRHKLVIMVLSYKTTDWKNLPEVESQWLDGFSVFSVDKDALVYKHICDKMIPDDDALLAKKIDFKSRVLGLLGLAPRVPAPGSLNALISCCKTPATFSCKKLT